MQRPSGMQPKPDSVTTNANTLQNIVTAKNWPKTALAMKSYDGVWKNAEAAYKRLVTFENNLRKLAANLKKSLRSTELKDAAVKQSLVAVNADLKGAAKLLRAKAGDYRKAKAAYPKIAAGYKAATKRK